MNNKQILDKFKMKYQTYWYKDSQKEHDEKYTEIAELFYKCGTNYDSSFDNLMHHLNPANQN